MKLDLRVATPPPKPLLVYDGDCNFCTLWVNRWRCTIGERIDYLPSQDPQIGARFPEIPPGAFEASVQLIEPDGAVYSGSEAVFRSMAHGERHLWLLDAYRHSRAFAKISERLYRFVSQHRTLFSLLTRLLWGRNLEPPSYLLVRRAFLGALGLIYFIAFMSLWSQIAGLAGHDGIVPAGLTMETIRHQTAPLGWSRFLAAPTLCWFGASDASLNVQCAAGSALAVLLVLGIAPAPCLFLLWLIYLSLCTVCEPFLNFQWDILLLETGFLAIFLAPLRLLPRRPGSEPPPRRLVVWLLRWVLFKLTFQSGCVKLLSGDPAWRHLTALNFHFETQPLPTWIGWYAHQLPDWVHRSDAAMMFVIELGVPFLIFAPRRPRQLACLALIALQSFILLTGNYGFFNFLVIALCVLLLDDAALRKCLPKNWCARTSGAAPGRHGLHWPPQVIFPVTAVALGTSLMQFCAVFGLRVPWPAPLIMVYERLMPLRSFNSYGLFAVMTTARPEIILEGSNDAVHWRSYEFKYKPGDLKRRPAFVAPYQPRLDWQMWFAALGGLRQNPWFLNFSIRLLQGSPDVLALLKENPFPRGPPRYLRAVIYQYQFTDPQTRRKTGAWWQRSHRAIFMPPISLPKKKTPHDTKPPTHTADGNSARRMLCFG